MPEKNNSWSTSSGLVTAGTISESDQSCVQQIFGGTVRLRGDHVSVWFLTLRPGLLLCAVTMKEFLLGDTTIKFGSHIYVIQLFPAIENVNLIEYDCIFWYCELLCHNISKLYFKYKSLGKKEECLFTGKNIASKDESKLFHSFSSGTENSKDITEA